MKEAYFRFTEWPVYQDAKKFARFCYSISRSLPAEHRFGLAAQIIRSSASVALNIAEGSGKQTDRDFNKYLNISRGSLFETIASLDILRDLGLITPKELHFAVDLSSKISNQITGLKKKLNRY